MASLAPGKGAHLILNEEVLSWLMSRLDVVQRYYDDEIHDSAPDTVILGLSNLDGWTKVKDGFGTKVYTAMPYKEGELRVTVVLTKQNELRLDIREWYEPKQ